MDSLVSRRELQVDADTAVLAAVGRAASRAGRHNVAVEGHVEDGASGIDVDIGVTRRTAGADGSDVEDLDLTGGWDRGSQGIPRRADDGSTGGAGEEDAREETHCE